MSTLFVVATVGIGAAAWSLVSAGGHGQNIGPARPMTRAAIELAEALKAARCRCSMEALDNVVVSGNAHIAAAPKDSGAWRLVAEAYLERAQQRIHLRGLRVGKPFFTELPEEFAGDIDAGLAAVTQAQLHGDDSSAIFRVKALLLSHQITSVFTALRYNGAIVRALGAASLRDAEAPELQIALGLRKLLSPEFFGHDAAGALAHFERAAGGGDDERSSIYAGMACHLQGQRMLAIEWLERASASNPLNIFAKVVLARLRKEESDPFGRDVTPAEVSAAKSR